MLSVQHNLSSMNAGRVLGITDQMNSKATEKLASGYRINRSADDAAGLAVSEKMRRQIRGLNRASANALDGISLVQIAEGALHEVHDMLQRANELAVYAATGSLTEADRAAADAELKQLKDEIDTTAQQTLYNTRRLFPDAGLSPQSSRMAENYHYTLTCDLVSGTFQVGSLSGGISAQAASGAGASSVLADKIANEFLPNAVKQIFDAFPSLRNAMGADTVDMALDVSFLDGPGNTLAYASYSFYSSVGTKPVSMSIKVDTADFTDADALGTGPNAQMLESTLAHELMHSVMQYNLTDGMSGRGGDPYPEWFIEGTAQLSGGGFTTGWNNQLSFYAGQLSGASDASKDADIAAYLKRYTMAGRPYGHGYLGSAYIGYLANGGTGPVTSAGIAAGMNRIFGQLLNGQTFANALRNTTGKTEQDLNRMFVAGDPDLVNFVRELSYASKGGAGSVITPGLSVGGTAILGNTAPTQAFRIDPAQVQVSANGGGSAQLYLQVGAEKGQYIAVNLYQMTAQALGIESVNIRTESDADNAIDSVQKAISYVSNVRSYYGAIQNRLEHTIANLDNTAENLTAAESRIRDTDMAKQMMEYSSYQILLRSGQAMLSQANRQPELVQMLLGQA